MPKLVGTKVSIFYEYKKTGFSETLYNTRSVSETKSEIPNYLKNRLAFADDDMSATYARISDMNQPRATDFLDLADQPGNTGKQTGDGSSPTDVILLKSTSTGGRSSHFFIHCFPASFIKQNVAVPAGKWGDLLKAWGDYMGSLSAGWGFLAASNPGVPGRIGITAAVPQTPRGCLLSVNDASTVLLGDTITIGGTSKDGFGYSGRKQILNVNLTTKQLLVGGAGPVGQIGVNAYFTKLTYAIAHMNQIQPVKLTERKVGKPQGLPVGRRSATLSLRR